MAPIDERIRQRQIIERSAPGAHRLNESRESTDPPPPDSEPPSKQKPHLFDVISRRWLAIAAMCAAAVGLVDIGMRLASGSVEAKLSKIESTVEKMRDMQEAQQTKVTEVVTELRVQDIVAHQKQSEKNFEELAAKELEDRKNLNMVIRSIKGLNATAAARGRPTPMPLQEP